MKLQVLMNTRKLRNLVINKDRIYLLNLVMNLGVNAEFEK